MAHMLRMTEQRDGISDPPRRLGVTHLCASCEGGDTCPYRLSHLYLGFLLFAAKSINYSPGLVPEVSLLECTSPHYHLEAPHQRPQRRCQGWMGAEGPQLERHRWLRTWS